MKHDLQALIESFRDQYSRYMPDDYSLEPSDLLAEWVMVVKPGERTQHFRTLEEAKRYLMSPTYRADVNRRLGM